MIGLLIHDVRFSLRMLAKSPLFSGAAIATLALGIGLNSATFSAVHGLLIRPPGGVSNPDELVQVYRKWPGLDYGASSIPHYRDVRDRGGEAFESTAAWTSAPVALSVDGRNERIMGVLASANLFQTLGVEPEIGRVFIPGEEDRDPGAHPVAVLGHSFWRTRFGADLSILGRELTLNGRSFEVVGVAPPEFKGPMPAVDIPIYVPIMMQREVMPGKDLLENRDQSPMVVVARLRPDRTAVQAEAVMDSLLAELLAEFPDAYRGQLGTTLITLSEAGLHPSFRHGALGLGAVLMGVVTLLLAIACLNVANLFLARAGERRREMGIRLSLGAGRRSILRQLLTESLLFSLLAGALGVGLAHAVTTALAAIELPVDGPFAFGIGVDATVLLFTLAVSVLAGLVFGLAPALQAAGTDLIASMKRGSDGGVAQRRTGRALVVFQVALSLVLLVGSGLFVRALGAATELDPGLAEPSQLVMASLDPGLQGYGPARTQDFYDRLIAKLESRSDVVAAALTNSVPLGFHLLSQEVEIPGHTFAEGERSKLYYAAVSEGYFDTAGIELLAGRTFARTDDAAGPPVLVNRRFADRFWPDGPALGSVVRTAGRDRRVIGIVETGKYRSLGEDPTEYFYLPRRELSPASATLLVRTLAGPAAVFAGVRASVRSLDPEIPLFDVRTVEDHLGLALLPARIGGAVLGLFGLLGLVLAGLGIYGVMAYAVVRRRREIGVRVALGAGRGQVIGLVLGDGLRLVAIGVGIGLVGAAAAARLVRGMLYTVHPVDPIVFGAVSAALVAFAALAVYLPARRAAAADPIRALSAD
ncbi:MAG: ABC transporter permease [Acidobacteriota bacterium]